MSWFGDERQHMNDWMDSLEQRAGEVGMVIAMEEYVHVLETFLKYSKERDL